MLNKLKALRNQAGEEGFTLIELLVVIIIIGILSAIALPLFFQQQAEGVKASVKSDVRNTVSEVATHLVSNPTDTNVAAATGTPADAVVAPVVTKDNVIAVAGAWNNYVVNGSAPSIDNWSYSYNSRTGQYAEGTGTAITPTTP